MIQLFNKSEKQHFMSTFQDPFKKESVDYVEMRIGRPFGGRTGQVTFNATVSFRNGDTTGDHDIKAEDFVSLCNKVKDFIDSI